MSSSRSVPSGGRVFRLVGSELMESSTDDSRTAARPCERRRPPECCCSRGSDESWLALRWPSGVPGPRRPLLRLRRRPPLDTRRSGGLAVLEGNRVGIPPEPLDAVELPLFGVEDVDDDIQVIKQNP